jgi:hypothetical protein
MYDYNRLRAYLDAYMAPLIARMYEFVRDWQDRPQVEQMLDDGCPNDEVK